MANKLLKKVINRYGGIGKFDTYKKCKKLLLYPTTLINSTVLGVITGVATGISINILTNFLGFNQLNGWKEFALLLMQFSFAFAFNVSLIVFTVRCSAFKEGLSEICAPGATRAIIEKCIKEKILEKYEEEYTSIYISFVSSIIFFVLVALVVIVIPVILFLLGQFGVVI